MEFVIVWSWIISVLIGALIGKYRGRVGSGIIWAFLLGPIGWLIVALMEDKRPICRFCGGVVIPGAIKCKNCGSDITPAVAPAKDKPSAVELLIGPTKDKPSALPPKETVELLVASGGIALFILAAVLILNYLEGTKTTQTTAKTASTPMGTPTSMPTAIPTPTPGTEMITLTKPVSVQLKSGTVTLPAGTKLEFVSQVGTEVHVRYLSSDQMIPISATDLK